MNRNIFVSILLILCLGGLLAVTVLISQYKPSESTQNVYVGIPENDYAKEFSINNFSYANIAVSHFYKYYSFLATVEEKEGETFIKEKTFDSSNMQIGDEFLVGDVLGQNAGQDVISEYEGVVLDVRKTEIACKVVITDQDALVFRSEFSQDINYLVSYEMKVEINVGNNEFILATVNQIDYAGLQNAKLSVSFDIIGSKARLFPGYTIAARIMTEDVGKLFFVPTSFFESYTLIANKSFEVYYIDGKSPKIVSMTIQTGEIYGDKIVIYSNSISEGRTIYLKQEA